MRFGVKHGQRQRFLQIHQSCRSKTLLNCGFQVRGTQCWSFSPWIYLLFRYRSCWRTWHLRFRSFVLWQRTRRTSIWPDHSCWCRLRLHCSRRWSLVPVVLIVAGLIRVVSRLRGFLRWITLASCSRRSFAPTQLGCRCSSRPIRCCWKS